MTTEATRRHLATGTIAALFGMLLSSGMFGVVWNRALKPSFVTAVAEEATQQVGSTIDTRVSEAVTRGIRPIQNQVRAMETQVQAGNAGLKAIIASNIAALERDIDGLIYIRDFPPAEDWTDELRRQLFELQNRLAVQRDALQAINSAEKETIKSDDDE